MSNKPKTNIQGDITARRDVIMGDQIVYGYTAEQIQTILADIGKNYQPKPFDGRCPYVGLRSFDESNAQWFFGRDTLIAEIVERLKTSRAIFVAGPSGSGKSSVVKAGLIRALKNDAFPHSNEWLYEVMNPGRTPLESLARVVAGLAKTTNARDELLSNGYSDSSVLHQWVDIALGNDSNRRVVIIVDQFEEIFTQLPLEREKERVAFLNLLTYAATVKQGRLIVAFTMRSDFVSSCAKYPQLNELLNQEFLQVGAMSPEELIQAIALPGLQVGLRVDSDLISQIISDMRDELGVLPLLQFTLRNLFDEQHKAGGVIALTREDYVKRGGLHKSLERHADIEFSKLNEREQDLARNIFKGLIGAQDTKRTALFDELVPTGISEDDVNAVVIKLANARLITTDEREVYGDQPEHIITIAHEKLIEAWPWLKKLVDENREAIALEMKIKDMAVEWERSKRDSSFLYEGARLETIREQIAAKSLTLPKSAKAFVTASMAKERRAKQRGRMITTVIVAAGVIAMVAAVVAGWFAYQSNINLSEAIVQKATAQAASTQAVQQKNTAELNFARSESLRLAGIASKILSSPTGNAETAALISVRALRLAYTIEADISLLEATSKLYTVKKIDLEQTGDAIFSPQGQYILTAGIGNSVQLIDVNTGVAIRNFVGHTGMVEGIAFSPNGQYVLTGSFDKTVRLWETLTGKEVRVFKSDREVLSVAFSPDGKYVLAGINFFKAILWDANSGKEIKVFGPHEWGVIKAKFSPDGRYIVTSGESPLFLWEVATGKQVGSFPSYAIGGFAFSPNGRYVLIANGGIADLFETSTTKKIRDYGVASSDGVYDVVFSMNGNRILTGGRTTRLWDVETGKQLRVFSGHTGSVTSVVMSPDDKYALTASYDHTLRLWNANIGKQEYSFIGHESPIAKVAFSPDGKFALTASWDKTARLWNAKTGEQIYVFKGHTGFITSASFSPDGKLIATGSQDNTVRMWRTDTDQPLRVFGTYEGQVTSVAFSPDGKYILINNWDGYGYSSGQDFMRLWNVETGQKVYVFSDHGSPFFSFSPDGKYMLFVGRSGNFRVWDVKLQKEIRAFGGNTLDVGMSDVAFSPDGNYIFTVFEQLDVNALMRIWDVRTGEEVHSFRISVKRVNDIALSPNGKFVLVATDDGTTQLLNAENGQEIRIFSGHTGEVYSVAFSPDGKNVLTGSFDHTAKIWDTDISDAIAWACSRIFRDLTSEERRLYRIEDSVPTCPK